MRQFITQTIHKYAPVFVFILFFSVSFTILFSSPNLLSSNDPFHLIHQAHAIWNNTHANLPILSTLQTMHPNSWYAFQLYLAPFVGMLENAGKIGLIHGAKVGHALLLSTFFTAFYFIFKHVLVSAADRAKDWDLKSLGIFFTVVLFGISPLFSFRLFMLRPHIFAIPLAVFAVWLLLEERWVSLFFTAAIFTFIYSASFLLLIPLVLYTTTKLFYIYKSNEKGTAFTPLFAGISGLGFGILLHPNPLAYLYNAYFVHVSSIGARFLWDFPVGAELFSPAFSNAEWVWLFPLVFAGGLYIIKTIDTKEIPERLHFKKGFLLVLSVFYLLLSVFVGRAIEYALPFGLIFLAVVFVDDVYPLWKRFINIPSTLQQDYPGIARTIQDFRKDFTKADTTFLQNSLVTVVGVIFATSAVAIGVQQYKSDSPYTYQLAAEYIKNHSSNGDIVFHPNWSDYSQLVFFNKKSDYIMGMDPMFTYWHDTDRYWLWYHLSYSQYVCNKPTCTEKNAQNPYSVIKDSFNAKFVFITEENDDKKDGQNLHKKIKSDNRFNKAISYQKNGNSVYVYQVRE